MRLLLKVEKVTNLELDCDLRNLTEIADVSSVLIPPPRGGSLISFPAHWQARSEVRNVNHHVIKHGRHFNTRLV